MNESQELGKLKEFSYRRINNKNPSIFDQAELREDLHVDTVVLRHVLDEENEIILSHIEGSGNPAGLQELVKKIKELIPE